MTLCQFKNILGEPGKCIHSIRIYNIAIIDFILTFLLARFNQIIFKKIFPFPYWVWLLATFCLGIIIHRVFCVNSTVNVAIFGKV